MANRTTVELTATPGVAGTPTAPAIVVPSLAPAARSAERLPVRATLFLWSVVVGGVVAVFWLWLAVPAAPGQWLRPEFVGGLLLLLAAGSVAGRWPLALVANQKLDLSSVPLFLGVLLIPPPLAALVGAVATGSASLGLGRPARNVLFNAGLYALACGAAAVSFQTGEAIGNALLPPGAAQLAGALAAGSIYLMITSSGTSAMAALRGGRRFWATWDALLRAGLAAEASFLAIGALVALALRQAPWLLVLTGVPLWLAYRAHRDAASLRAVTAKLQAVLDQQRRFVSDTAHELKTPLTTIRGNAELLLRDSRPATLDRELLRDIVREAARLSRTIADLLTLAQMEERLALRREAVDLETLVYDSYRQFRAQANGVGLRLTGLDEVDGGLCLEGDPDRLRQLLANLLDNALKYTPPGGIVELRVAREAAWAVVSVADTGPGIPPEHLPRIFDRYYRARPAGANGSRLGGVGLGLAIARAIVDAHGGVIGVASTPGHGSTFTVRLPLVPPLAGGGSRELPVSETRDSAMPYEG